MKYIFIRGWYGKSNGNGLSVKMYPSMDHLASIAINDICDEGYTFEGLSFDSRGKISNLYFRKEQQ